MQTLAPVQTSEREIFMDVLRGFAILGIFIANLGSGLSWYYEDAKLAGPFLVPDWDHKMSFNHHMMMKENSIPSSVYYLAGVWRSATYKKWQPMKKNNNTGD